MGGGKCSKEIHHGHVYGEGGTTGCDAQNLAAWLPCCLERRIRPSLSRMGIVDNVLFALDTTVVVLQLYVDSV